MSKTAYYDESLLQANTPNGKDWLRKVLHPPSEKGSSYNGYPDQSTIPAIHSEYRQNFEQLPTVLRDENTSVLLLLTPGLFGPIWAATSVGNANTNEWRIPYENKLVNRTDLGRNFIKRRVGYKSTTIELDSTMFTNQGMVYSATFSPSIDIITGSQALVRYSHCKRSTDILKSAIDRRTKATCSDADAYEFVGSRSSAPPPTPNVNSIQIQIVKLGLPITNPSDVTMISPKSYTARAPEGAFAVQQCNQPTNPWLDLEGHRYTNGTNTSNDGCYLTFYETEQPGGGVSLFYLFDALAVNPLDWLEVDMRNWEFKFIYFQNLSASVSSSPLLSFKIVHGEEWAPSPRGFLNSLALPPALYDRQALESAAIITQARQDAMPAKFNNELSAIAKPLLEAGASAAIGALGKAIRKPAPTAVNETTAEAVKESTNVANEQLSVPEQRAANISVVGQPIIPLHERFSMYPRPRTPRPRTQQPRPSRPKRRSPPQDLKRQMAKLSIRVKNLNVKPKQVTGTSKKKTRK